MKLKIREALFPVLLALIPLQAQANAYAPWDDCKGLAAGDECGSPGGYYCGECKIQEDCTNDSGDGEDECLYCESIANDTRCGSSEDTADQKDDDGCSASGGMVGSVFGLQALVGVAGLLLMFRRKR